MKIMQKVEIDHSLCYEFLAGLLRLPNNEEFMPEDKPNQEIFEWFQLGMEKVTPEIQQKLKVFCDLRTAYLMTLSGYVKRWRVKSVPQYIAQLKQVPVEEILQRFLFTGFGPGQWITPEDVRELLVQPQDAIRFINENLSVSPEDKWQILQFIHEPEQMRADLLELLTWFYDALFHPEEERLNELINQFDRELAARLQRYDEEYLRLMLPFDFSKDTKIQQITLALSYFYESSSMFNGLEEVYLFGYRYHEKIEGRHSVLAGTQLFKALADETRLNILRVLAERPWYGHELAQHLNISNSTVSHHVGTLMVNGLIKSYREDNRLYLELNVDQMKTTILKAIDDILQLKQ